MSTTNADFLAISRNPLRLFASPAPWLALCYLLSYIITSAVLFTVALTVLLVSGILGLLGVGLPLLIGAALVVRGLASFERLRLGLTQSAGEPPDYLPTAGSGFIGHLRILWSDPATWRNISYLVFLWPLLLALDIVAFVIWVGCLGLISLPLWYWSVPQRFPNGEKAHGVAFGYFPDGPGQPARGLGLWVHDIPTSLLAAGIGVALLLLVGNFVLTGAARMHAATARALVGGHSDPLKAAKAVLTGPGPLGTLTPGRASTAAVPAAGSTSAAG